MRLRTLGAVCATSAVGPISTVVPPASAQAPPAPPVQPSAAPPPGDMNEAAVALHANRYVYVARRYQELVGQPLSKAERQALRQEVVQLTPPKLRAKTRDLRDDIRSLRVRLRIAPQLEAIARCESRNDPRAISAGGTYRGKYQFSFSTWQSVGGRGDPAAAPETEQDRRAARLYRTGGPGHWPVCGR